MKTIILILLGLFMLLCAFVWFMACLFACGQLYNTYDLFTYFTDAPIAVGILLILVGAAVALFVVAFRTAKHKDKKELS